MQSPLYAHTHAPVAQRATVWLLLILKNLIDLKSKQSDVTATNLHSSQEEDEKSMLKYLLVSSSKVPMEMTRFLASRKFLMLGNCSLPEAPFDPCHDQKAIAICFHYNLIFLGKYEKGIFDLVIQLHFEVDDLEPEDDAVIYLGVHSKHYPKTNCLLSESYC
ncbi:hypothetical protein ACHAXS_002219 [Conticribra weissflogii]